MVTRPAKRPKLVVLCILDGFGHCETCPENAIDLASMPVFKRWWRECPHALLKTSGPAVGLPEGQMGNSEVGHTNIGAGRVVMQDLPRIEAAVKSGALTNNPLLQKAASDLITSGKAFHVLGLLSPGGVHAHQDHIAAIAETVAVKGVPVFVHAILDGRDTPPRSALGFLREFEKRLAKFPNVRIGTVSGRYYAMDRDRRWERIEKAFKAMVRAEGVHAKAAEEAVSSSYAKNVGDEFVLPTVINGYPGMKDGDAFLMANFRADRARQILLALSDPAFKDFDRGALPKLSARLGMVEYSEDLNQWLRALFGPAHLKDCLGEIVSKAGMKQLRIAETEKYAHVTFFFNGGEERMFAGEERVLVPSPRVATYDLKPEMSAFEVTDKLTTLIREKRFDFIVVNFANPDMVGHTGILAAAIKALEAVDSCLGKIEAALKEVGGVLLLTADHGNVEQMFDPTTHGPHTAHTTCEVPVVLVDPANALVGNIASLKDGSLADVAPTLLALLGLEKPLAMTGGSLLVEKASA
jgi:2,3-bisphosphoglycerate-independent phosphoglycerate mutase